jgi:hypothetical protein
MTIVFAGGLAPLAVAQSLADVARKEEERRKEIKEPAKVYTNKDLRGVLPAPPVPPPDASKAVGDTAATKDTEQAGEEKDKEPVKDQAYWSARIKELRTQLDRDQTYAEALQSRISALTTDFVNRDDPAQRAVIERDRQKAVAELDRLKQSIEADKKAVADLEEEARRAGVPPGWLRS